MVKTFEEAYELLKPYPSDFFMSIMLAQWALESDKGRSELAIEAFNFTGHKAQPDEWPADRVYKKDTIEDDGEGTKFIAPKEPFRLYHNPQEWAKHHASWLQRLPDTYAKAINAKTVEEQAQALQGTYATDTSYAKKLTDMIKANNLTRYDKKESVQMTFPKPAMTDRRKHALGYPGHGVYARRSKSAIKNIVWHYTAVKRSLSRKIWDHEQYWKSTHGWDIGGYHYYIDSDGKIYWNYDLEIATYGASAANPYTMHISVEANSASDYSQAQIKAREDLTLWLLTNDLKHLTGQSMRGHKEVPGNSTSCPGYSVAQLNQFRADLDEKLKGGVKPTPPQVVKPTSDNQYTVKHGDTLWLVATAHGLTLNQIRELNPTRKNDTLYTGDKLRVKGDVPKVDAPTDGKEQGLKNPKEYPYKGTFEFNQSSAVRNSPRLDNKVVANYNKGERVNYDRILYGASYTWLSYISHDGTRRYVACGDNGQLYGKFV